MLKSIILKEWLKTRWYLIFAAIATLAFSAFLMLRMHRAIDLKGAAHIWEVMLLRDTIFINSLSVLPLLVGLVLALMQFYPEMQRKCLKLTLHLPCSRMQTTLAMLLYGLLALIVCFAMSFILMRLSMQPILPPELIKHVLLSSLPWFTAGIAAYLLGAWVILEPTWKRRIAYILLSALLLRIFFVSETPEAYNQFMPWLALLTLLCASLSWLSVHRFIDGQQD